MDLVRIGSVAAGEAVRQQVGLEGLINLLKAYETAVYYATETNVKVPDYWKIHSLANLIEPHKNHDRYRKLPVTFQDGGGSANPQDVEKLMTRLLDNLPSFYNSEYYVADVQHWVREFLWIHPFIDGNGRVAWIIYNWLLNKLDYPDPLPDFFGVDSQQIAV